jgi:hypothetical protein
MLATFFRVLLNAGKITVAGGNTVEIFGEILYV